MYSLHVPFPTLRLRSHSAIDELKNAPSGELTRTRVLSQCGLKERADHVLSTPSNPCWTVIGQQPSSEFTPKLFNVAS